VEEEVEEEEGREVEVKRCVKARRLSATRSKWRWEERGLVPGGREGGRRERGREGRE